MKRAVRSRLRRVAKQSLGTSGDVNEMNPCLLQMWLLRLTGTVEFGAFLAVAMPRRWMEIGHHWLGLGEMPEGPIVDFIIRQASFTYGLHGVLLWLLSSDVARFRPLVVFSGISYLLAAPVFFLIDWNSGMPWFWTVGDVGSCLCVGVGLLLLDRWAQPAWKRRKSGAGVGLLLLDRWAQRSQVVGAAVRTVGCVPKSSVGTQGKGKRHSVPRNEKTAPGALQERGGAVTVRISIASPRSIRGGKAFFAGFCCFCQRVTGEGAHSRDGLSA